MRVAFLTRPLGKDIAICPNIGISHLSMHADYLSVPAIVCAKIAAATLNNFI